MVPYQLRSNRNADSSPSSSCFSSYCPGGGRKCTGLDLGLISACRHALGRSACLRVLLFMAACAAVISLCSFLVSEAEVSPAWSDDICEPSAHHLALNLALSSVPSAPSLCVKFIMVLIGVSPLACPCV